MLEGLYMPGISNQSLKDIFSGNLENKSNKSAVVKALDIVQRNIDARLEGYPNDTDVRYFFSYANEPTEYFYELMDFWETVKNHLYLLTEDEQENYNILSLVYEMDAHFHWRKYLRLSSDMGGYFEKRVGELCLAIEEIYNNRVIKFLDANMKVEYEISLRGFEKELASFEYMFVRYHIAKAMKTGGIVVVIAGLDGLTPKRLHGYLLKNFDWCTYPAEVLQSHRDMLLADCVEEKLRGCG